MMSDEELAMAYADGELDMLAARRFEKRMTDEPELAELVARQRRLRDTVAGAFGSVVEQPVPEALVRQIRGPEPAENVVALKPRPASAKPMILGRNWAIGGAIAASLVFGLMLGRGIDQGDVVMRNGALVAQGSLGQSLDRQLASTQGDADKLRMLVSFKGKSGDYCRVFQGRSIDGIACKHDGAWQLRATNAGSLTGGSAYRQAGSADASLMAQAQAMMAGTPLDQKAEARARASNWR